MKNLFFDISRRLLPLFAILLYTTVFAQSKSDSIIKHTGERIGVKIISVDEDAVMFSYPNETATNTISLNSVSEIIFSNGRVQKCSEKIVVNGVQDWENVIITNNPADIKGLVRKGEVRSSSNNTWSFKGKMMMDKKATKKIKRAAAALKACIILITDQVKTNTTLWAGSTNSKFGIAYSYE